MSLLDYLDRQTVRDLPPWIRRFLSRCHPKRVVRVPMPMNHHGLQDRDRTIRYEHWRNRQDGLGWRQSIRVLAHRHDLTYETVRHIVRRRQGGASNVTTSPHAEVRE